MKKNSSADPVDLAFEQVKDIDMSSYLYQSEPPADPAGDGIKDSSFPEPASSSPSPRSRRTAKPSAPSEPSSSAASHLIRLTPAVHAKLSVMQMAYKCVEGRREPFSAIIEKAMQGGLKSFPPDVLKFYRRILGE